MATFADGFELFNVVGDLEETSGAFKAAVFLAEVEAKAIGHDGDVELDGDLHELVGLIGCEELCFVDQDAGDAGVVFCDLPKEVGGFVEAEVGFAFGADAG